MSNNEVVGGYAVEKVYQALSSLIAESPLSNRLSGAATVLIRLRESDLPDELLPDFLQIMQKLTDKPEQFPGEGKIAASVRALSDSEADQTAKAILNLFVRLKGGL